MMELRLKNTTIQLANMYLLFMYVVNDNKYDDLSNMCQVVSELGTSWSSYLQTEKIPSANMADLNIYLPTDLFTGQLSFKLIRLVIR